MTQFWNLLALASALSLLVAGGAALAEDEPAPAPNAGLRSKMLAEFDEDGDGRLSKQERQVARETRRLRRWDEDGDGELSDAERGAAKAARRGAAPPRFDTDGDGVLSASEREAAKEQRRLEREELRAKYDADGDGRLSRSEREAARADGALPGRAGGGKAARRGRQR